MWRMKEGRKEGDKEKEREEKKEDGEWCSSTLTTTNREHQPLSAFSFSQRNGTALRIQFLDFAINSRHVDEERGAGDGQVEGQEMIPVQSSLTTSPTSSSSIDLIVDNVGCIIDLQGRPCKVSVGAKYVCILGEKLTQPHHNWHRFSRSQRTQMAL